MANSITVKAGPHSRINCPVTVALTTALDAKKTYAVRTAGGQTFTAQVISAADGAQQLFFILPELAAGQDLALDIVEAPLPLNTLKLEQADDTVNVMANGKLFTTLHYGANWVRPFMHPVIGPYGSNLTRTYPLVLDLPGETKDHPHQKSFWTAWGDVNGTDNWSELERGHGSIKTTAITILENGPVRGKVALTLDWLSDQGVKELSEEREMTYYQLPGGDSIVDLEVVFRATEGDVKFGDTKEGGICSIRVASSMDAKLNGTIVNSYGGVGEAETWGKRAEWCDYYGPIPGGIAGICIMDNPDNYCYPTFWHVRNYGLMTANPFGLSYFYNDPAKNGSLTLKAGETLTFQYRVFFHAGDTKQAAVAERYHDYINPPKAAPAPEA
ncbi:MAG: PmoA family protein [Lentisphaeria bacterium]|nr:PmoA family protein [Lentisphaeria bacterium]